MKYPPNGGREPLKYWHDRPIELIKTCGEKVSESATDVDFPHKLSMQMIFLRIYTRDYWAAGKPVIIEEVKKL